MRDRQKWIWIKARQKDLEVANLNEEIWIFVKLNGGKAMFHRTGQTQQDTDMHICKILKTCIGHDVTRTQTPPYRFIATNRMNAILYQFLISNHISHEN